MAKIDVFCTYTPLKVLAISASISFVLGIILTAIVGATARETLYLAICPLLVGINIFLSLASYSIYLNVYKSVRNNIFLSALSFYLPILFVCFIFFVAIPFLIPQTYYFIRFRKQLKSGELMDDFYYECSNEYVENN